MVHTILGFNAQPLPALSWEMQDLIRVSYALLSLLTFSLWLPNLRHYFLSEKFGGYVHLCNERLHTPLVAGLMIVVWIMSLGLMLLGFYTVIASFLNLILCHFYFIQMRWK